MMIIGWGGGVGGGGKKMVRIGVESLLQVVLFEVCQSSLVEKEEGRVWVFV